MLIFLILLLPPLLSQPYVLLTSDLKTLQTSRPFYASIFPDDCFSDPCYYKIRTSSQSYQGQVSGQTSVKIISQADGEQNIYASIIDNDDQTNLFPVLANNSLAPTVVIPINVKQAVSCHEMQFSINGTVISQHNFEGEVELQISIISSSGEAITSNYFYNSIRPVFTFDNGTISFQTTGVDSNRHWTVTLTKEFLQNPGYQRAWLVRANMAQYAQGGCTVHSNTLVISHHHAGYSTNLGPTVTPVLTSSTLQYRQGPCSRNMLIVFQSGSQYFGISLNNLGSITWYNINSLPGLTLSNAVILDFTVTAFELIISTDAGLVTHSTLTNTLKHLNTAYSFIFSPSFCPSHSNQQVVAVADSTAYISTEPYTTWSPLELNTTQLSGWSPSSLKHVFYDSLWGIYIFALANSSSVIIQSQIVSGEITQSPVVTEVTGYRGTFFHPETSYMFVYGRKIFFSKVRGEAALVEVVDLGADVVSDMSSCGMSGDIVAVTEGGAVYLSNIALVRFTQLHTSPFALLHTSLHTFYTFDHHTHLNLYTVNTTDHTPSRYLLPSRSLMDLQYQPAPADLTLRILGKHKFELVAKGQVGFFKEAYIGKVIVSSDGAKGRIYSYDNYEEDGVDYSVALVNTMAHLPYAVTDYSNNSVVVSVHNETHYYLTLPDSKVWYVSDVGHNVQIFFCTSFLVTEYVNSTTVLSEATHPEQACIGPHKHWMMTNWAANSPVISLSINDSAEITATTVSGYEVTISFADKSNLTGLIIRLGAGGGVVQAHDNTTLIISTGDSFSVGDTFSATYIKLHELGAGSLTDLPVKPTWSIRENSCYHTFISELAANITQPLDRAIRYIDTFEEEEIPATISAFQLTDIEEDIKLQVYFDNRDEFNFSMEAHRHNHLMELEAHLVHHQLTGGVYTPLVVKSNTVSLQCDVPVLLYQINRGCNTHRTLHIRYPGNVSEEDFLFLSPTDSNGDEIIKDLPVNYRPPSNAGIAIPTSAHVYNADPSKPMYTEYYNVSKHSYQYNQCKGAVDAANCSCGQYERLSDLALHSDCKQRVYQLFYTDSFTPDLYLRQFGQDYISLNKPYVITEVNGREEYKAEALTKTEVGSYNYSISFTATGLFHFHVEVISGTICTHETEFILFIVQPPLSTTSSNVITAVTGFCIAVVILLFYTVLMPNNEAQVMPLKGSSRPLKGSSRHSVES